MPDSSRKWIFTDNNPVSTALPVWKGLKYRVYQLEKGAAGTPHLQGFVCFANSVRLSQLKKLLPRAHFEAARGSIKQNKKYCTKEEGRLEGPFEHGEEPVERPGSRTDLSAACELAKANRFKEIDCTSFVRYHRGLLAYSYLFHDPRTTRPTVIWLWGNTGSGKSRTAYNIGGDDQYWKPAGKWWDGYRQQQTCIIDDIRATDYPFNKLLQLLDYYPHRVEPKGGYIEFNSNLVIITSPRKPEDIYQEEQECLVQLTRRCNVILEINTP